MALVDELRDATGRIGARSFELMGEGLALVSGAHLRRAASAYAADLERVKPSLRPSFEREQGQVLAEAHRWLHRYNRSVHTRLRGYLELGRRCGFAYPWPVVAMLGICQVLSGIARSHAYGLLGIAATRLRFRRIEELVEGSGDVLRRTNRGIFADSVPTVLYALHCAALRRRGEGELADALLLGPLPPVMDEECRTLARELDALLARPEGPYRFRAMAALTRRHFVREQEIFSHHIGVDPERPPPRRARGFARHLTAITEVPAPQVIASVAGRRLVFRPYKLPPDFDIRDHEARVAEFSRAFVESVTKSPDDYRAAVAYVERRFETSRRRRR